MTKPRVSVVMPVYNTPLEHLREAIDSILSQSFTDFEYLIVNDSPENSHVAEAILSYDDSRIKFFKNDKNRGIEYSTNKLIKESIGDYVAIFDHDDISLPGRLEEEVNFLDKNKNVGAVSCQFEVFGKENWVSNNPVSSGDIKEALSDRSCVSHTGLMIRRSVLVENEIYYEKKFFPASSYRLITQIALVSNICNLESVLLRYRLDGNNTSIKHADKREAMRTLIQEEYNINKDLLDIRDFYSFDSVEPLNKPPFLDNKRYYKARKSNDFFFIKKDSHNFINEFNMASLAYKRSDEYFIEPISEYHSKSVNYLVMKWSDGISLDQFLSSDESATISREGLVEDLYGILSTLREIGIVHRDIIPRNFLVENKKIKLIDFYYAVYFDDYSEPEHVRDNILYINSLGEEFSAGKYVWDDNYSFAEVAKYVIGKKIYDDSNKMIQKIISDIGSRVVSPSIEMFHNSLVNQDKQIDKLSMELKDKQLHINNLEKQIRDRDHAIILVNEKVNDIFGSKSWFLSRLISAPFRLMRRYIKWKN